MAGAFAASLAAIAMGNWLGRRTGLLWASFLFGACFRGQVRACLMSDCHDTPSITPSSPHSLFQAVVSSVLCRFVEDVSQLLVLRLVYGVGIGLAMQAGPAVRAHSLCVRTA